MNHFFKDSFLYPYEMGPFLFFIPTEISETTFWVSLLLFEKMNSFTKYYFFHWVTNSFFWTQNVSMFVCVCVCVFKCFSNFDAFRCFSNSVYKYLFRCFFYCISCLLQENWWKALLSRSISVFKKTDSKDFLQIRYIIDFLDTFLNLLLVYYTL